jgi:hypothetical protein
MRIKLTKEEIIALRSIIAKIDAKGTTYTENHCPVCGVEMDCVWCCDDCFHLAWGNGENKDARKKILGRCYKLGITPIPGWASE